MEEGTRTGFNWRILGVLPFGFRLALRTLIFITHQLGHGVAGFLPADGIAEYFGVPQGSRGLGPGEM